MRADVRIRIRGGVIRIRIAEACIRTVIRITAEQDTTKNDQPFFVLCHNCLLLNYLQIRYKAKARADARTRIRGGVRRIRIAEARLRTVSRTTAEQDTT